LLPIRLPDKVQKVKWLKPIKTYDRAFRRLITGTEAAEKAANKVERAAARPVTPRQDKSDEDGSILVPSTPPNTGEIMGES
jgi:BRCT domain type II-containing protein